MGEFTPEEKAQIDALARAFPDALIRKSLSEAIAAQLENFERRADGAVAALVRAAIEQRIRTILVSEHKPLLDRLAREAVGSVVGKIR